MKDVHLKLQLQPKNGNSVEALWFNAASGLDLEPGSSVDLAFCAQISSFRGRERLEFRIRDLTAVE